ncbi:hypothetical protein [Sphingobium chlorophenolicum]|uniref:hypothetical protein n=1 Tax=Sphingobium chlorophenolicum TaxID=46429 RepID=UPI003F68968C
MHRNGRIRADAPRLSPTQPFSAIASLIGPPLNEARMWGLTPFDQLWCRVKFRHARYEGIFTPPQGSLLPLLITYPGYLGGTNWGGLTVDARKGHLMVNMSHTPMYTHLIPRKQADAMGVEPVRPAAREHWRSWRSLARLMPQRASLSSHRLAFPATSFPSAVSPP